MRLEFLWAALTGLACAVIVVSVFGTDQLLLIFAFLAGCYAYFGFIFIAEKMRPAVTEKRLLKRIDACLEDANFFFNVNNQTNEHEIRAWLKDIQESDNFVDARVQVYDDDPNAAQAVHIARTGPISALKNSEFYQADLINGKRKDYDDVFPALGPQKRYTSIFWD